MYCIGLLLKTSLALGIIGAKIPNTMQAIVFPNAHSRNGIIPKFCAIWMPTISDPTPAHVAAMDIE
jgi:hypothetical protein